MGLGASPGGPGRDGAERPDKQSFAAEADALAEQIVAAHLELAELRPSVEPVSEVRSYSKTPLNRTTMEFSSERAKEFLGAKLPWGETGRDFIERLRAAGNDDLTFGQIKQGCDLVARNASQNVVPRELQVVIARATKCGLIVIGQSFGYSCLGSGPEIPQQVYAVASNPEVLALLGGQHVARVDTKEIMDLLNDSRFFPPSVPVLQGLSAKAFFSFFNKPQSLVDALSNPGFFPEGVSGVKDPGVLTSFRAKLEAAVGYGLLTATPGVRAMTYLLSAEGTRILAQQK